MRHRKQRSKLSMMTAHRDAMLKNMVRNLVIYQTVSTTVARAKVARRLAEKLITLTKDDSVLARRRAFDILHDRDLVLKLFKETAPLFKNRSSGFTRIIPTGFRMGDGAQLCIFELTEKKVIEKMPKKKKEKSAQGTEERKVAKQKEEHKKEPKAEESKIKTIPKSKPTVDEEKRSEKARSEERKMADKRGFMKNLRGLFRKRGD